MDLSDEFTQALEGTIEAAKARNYNPAYFMRMLAEYGGVKTAKRLLANKEKMKNKYMAEVSVGR